MNAAARIPDRRALLHSVSGRLAKAVIDADDDYGNALRDVLAERRDLSEWEAAVDELRTSRLTVGEVLEREHAR